MNREIVLLYLYRKEEKVVGSKMCIYREREVGGSGNDVSGRRAKLELVSSALTQIEIFSVNEYQPSNLS